MVTLRPLREDDLSFLLEVRNDISTRINLENSQSFTLEECQEWFKNLQHPWFIIINEQGERVGYFRTSGLEVGCDIHPDYRRRGYARHAYLVYLEDKDRATLWVFEDNFAKNLYTSIGFKPTVERKYIRGREYINMEFRR